MTYVVDNGPVSPIVLTVVIPRSSVMSTRLTPHERKNLIKAAIEAKKFAYNKYSKFRVGAALITPEGSIIKGANVENASYGGTICAERTAIVKAVSDGMQTFNGLAVVTDLKGVASPCGLCRQVIREFCAPEMPILLVPGNYPHAPEKGSETHPGIGPDGVLETNIAELLPISFGPEQLEMPRVGD
jgi:cytidine deaminase